MFDLSSVNDVLGKVTGRGDAVVMLWQDADGVWKPITSNELYGRVRALADVFRGWGLGKGDRVAIVSENRWEWAVTDLATLAIGGVDVPLYPTLTPEQIGYMVRDSGAKAAVVSSREQYEKLMHAGDLPELKHVVVMDAGEFSGAESFGALMKDAKAKQQLDAAFDAMAKEAKPEDLATIIYTSGTTGEPKGVMLTHGNLASNVNYSTGKMGFGEKDSCISFLPLSHVTARHTDYALLCHGVRLAYCPKFDQLAVAMRAVKPTIFLAVPRVYEKIRQAVEGKSAASPVKLKILRWALETGVSPVLICSALAQGVRLLGRVGSAPRGASSAALAAEVGAPPWKIDRVRQQLRGWHPNGIARALHAVAEADAQVKGEATSAAYALERAVRRIVASRGDDDLS